MTNLLSVKVRDNVGERFWVEVQDIFVGLHIPILQVRVDNDLTRSPYQYNDIIYISMSKVIDIYCEHSPEVDDLKCATTLEAKRQEFIDKISQLPNYSATGYNIRRVYDDMFTTNLLCC